MGELERKLKWFKRDKIPGPNGWSIEFYIAFFENIKQDLLKVFKDYRLIRCMYEAIISTFIALISKVESPHSFNDFRPISLYNFLYKIITKIIVNHLNPILYTHISYEKFFILA